MKCYRLHYTRTSALGQFERKFPILSLACAPSPNSISMSQYLISLPRRPVAPAHVLQGMFTLYLLLVLVV
jgi:hypothetical protein